MERWNGKVAVVTGATAGIGYAIAEKLVENGLQVVGLARRQERLDALAAKTQDKKGKFIGHKTDISNKDEILVAFKWIQENVGPVSLLVNNAGLSMSSPIINGDIDGWKRILDTNLYGLTVATSVALKYMKENNIDDGHIININSIAGHSVVSFPNLNVYSATKFGVTAFTETVRKELSILKSKIKITSLSPGVVDTEIYDANGLRDQPGFKEFWEDAPILLSEDVANAVLYVVGTPPNVQVVGLARRQERLDALAAKTQGKKGKFIGHKTDISNKDEILAAFKWIQEHIGPVSLLVNNAGLGSGSEIINADLDAWKRVIDTNLYGLTVATSVALKYMTENNIDDGHIININSVLGHRAVPFPNQNVYPATKFGVTAFTETVRKELSILKSKIKITSLSPGLVDTEIFVANGYTNKPGFNEYQKDAPILLSEDIANAVIYVVGTPPNVQVTELTIQPTGEIF